MRHFWKFFFVFLAITGAIALMNSFFGGAVGLQFRHFNYWDYHGFFFLLLITFFPRITLLFSSVLTGGVLWWLGWFFAPRFLVAVLATLNYWYENPILVVISWMIALGGESSEKYVLTQRNPWRPAKGYKSAKWVDAEVKKSRS